MNVDLTKPIEPIQDQWRVKVDDAKYIETCHLDGVKHHIVRVLYSDGDVDYYKYSEKQIHTVFRNVRTLAERCKEELKGATEVRVWGMDVACQGIKCDVLLDSGMNWLYAKTGIFGNSNVRVLENFMLEYHSSYVTPVTWTPEEAAQLAEELGL